MFRKIREWLSGHAPRFNFGRRKKDFRENSDEVDCGYVSHQRILHRDPSYRKEFYEYDSDFQPYVNGMIIPDNPEDLYKLALLSDDPNVPLIENRLIESVKSVREASFLRFFAEDISGANIDNLQKAVEKFEYAEILADFAKCVPGADIERLQTKVLEIGENFVCLDFARNVVGSDQLLLAQRAFRTPLSPFVAYNYLDEFDKYFPQFHFKEIHDELVAGVSEERMDEWRAGVSL